jgi:hypothetical protein
MLPGFAWQTTLAFGRNEPSSGTATNAWLLESALILASVHTLFARAERVGKDDLLATGPFPDDRAFTIGSLSLGYIRDFATLGEARLGVGASITADRYPAALHVAYGDGPVSYLLFLRIKL